MRCESWVFRRSWVKLFRSWIRRGSSSVLLPCRLRFWIRHKLFWRSWACHLLRASQASLAVVGLRGGREKFGADCREREKRPVRPDDWRTWRSGVRPAAGSWSGSHFTESDDSDSVSQWITNGNGHLPHFIAFVSGGFFFNNQVRIVSGGSTQCNRVIIGLTRLWPEPDYIKPKPYFPVSCSCRVRGSCQKFSTLTISRRFYHIGFTWKVPRPLLFFVFFTCPHKRGIQTS
jgi:hypothetical protein